MKSKKKITLNDEIDLSEIILVLWKHKLLILIFTLFFTVAGYIYSNFQPKAYQTTVTIQEAPDIVFKKYSDLLPARQKINFKKIIKDYNKEFRFFLMSSSHLKNFLTQSEKFSEFKSYIKTDNFKFLKNKGKYRLYTLTFTFSKPLPSNDFLNNYVIYTKQITKDMFVEKLIPVIENEIKIYNQNIEATKIINLENPHPQVGVSSHDLTTFFYKGSKVLNLQKLYLEQSLEQIENFTLNYNPILVQDLSPTLITRQPPYMAASFFIGLFFSIIIIFIRSTLSI